MGGDVRDMNANRDPNYGFVLQLTPFHVFVCQGETPQFSTGEVFIDVDDQEPLVPDQVKPTCSLSATI